MSWTDRVKPDARLERCVTEWEHAPASPRAPSGWTWELLAVAVAMCAIVAFSLFDNPALMPAAIGVACLAGVLYALIIASRLWSRHG